MSCLPFMIDLERSLRMRCQRHCLSTRDSKMNLRQTTVADDHRDAKEIATTWCRLKITILFRTLHWSSAIGWSTPYRHVIFWNDHLQSRRHPFRNLAIGHTRERIRISSAHIFETLGCIEVGMTIWQQAILVKAVDQKIGTNKYEVILGWPDFKRFVKLAAATRPYYQDFRTYWRNKRRACP